MPTRRETIASAAALGVGGLTASALGNSDAGRQPSDPSRLVVVWSSGDPDVAHRVCLMYTHAARTNGWFDDVHLILWGPSQRLLVGDKDLKDKIASMRTDGVVVEACVACARTFGLVDALGELGLPVRGMGVPLTEALKDPGTSVVTF